MNEVAKGTEELAKMHCLHALFSKAMAKDEYLASHLKTAIESSVIGTGHSPTLDKFAQAALRLFARHATLPPSYGLAHIDIQEQGFEPLWVREQCIGAFKRLSGYNDALLVVSGLTNAVRGPRRYWTKRLEQQRQDAIRYIDALALKWTTANTRMTVLYS